MDTEESFLRDQVHRLNSVLSQYHQKYGTLTSKEDSTQPYPPASWTVDKSVLSPLIQEYDNVIQLQKRDIDRYKNELNDLRSHVGRLIAENKRLTLDLKENIQISLDGISAEVTKPSSDDDELIENLQQQLQLALKEKASTNELWQTASLEIERLESELEHRAYDPKMQILEQQLLEVNNEYKKTIGSFTDEIYNLREELRKSKNEAKVSEVKASDLKNTLEQLRRQLQHRDNESTELLGQDEATASRMNQLENQNIDLENKLSALSQELTSAKKEKESTKQNMMLVIQKSEDYEEKLNAATTQMRKNNQLVDEALIEKQQANIREKQKDEELQKLQDVISKLVNEAGIRTKQEVENVKKQYNNNLERLMEELQNLEIENSEKQAQLDRAIREKRSVESELEKIYQEYSVHGSRERNSYDELYKRVCLAERVRDEATIKVDSLQNSMKRTEMNFTQEKSQLQARIDQITDRHSKLKQDFENVNEDRMKYLDENDDLKKRVLSIQKQTEALERKFNKDVACIEHDQQLTTREHDVKIQSLEESHGHALKEVRQMLLAQQRMSAKWKDECQCISQKYEGKIADLRSEVARHRKRNEDLTVVIKECRQQIQTTEDKMSEYSRSMKRMAEKTRQAENRATQASQQAAQHIAQQRKLLQERRKLQIELDRNKMDQDIYKPGSSTRLADPLGISDLKTTIPTAHRQRARPDRTSQYSEHESDTDENSIPLSNISNR